MSQPQATPAENQKLDPIEQILHVMIRHADTHKGFLATVESLTPADWLKPDVARIAVAGLSKTPAKLATQIEDLTTIVQHIERLKALAAERGYNDILEFLNQKLPYDRNY